MEENPVELFDYFRVVWKRKILIIVVTLVCLGIGVGVGVMNSMSKLPESYIAEVVVKIGKKVRLMSTSSISISTSNPLVAYIEDPGLMVQTIPLFFNAEVKESHKYRLGVKKVGSLAMIRLTLEGSDKGVERVLKGLVDRLIDEHSKKANDAVVAYKGYMKTLEADAKMIQKRIAVTEASIKEMKRKEGQYLVKIESRKTETQAEDDVGDRSAFLNMLYLKTIDRERELSRSWAALRKIQSQLIMQKITLGNLEEYKTEVLGIEKYTVITPRKRSNIHILIIAGVVGLIISLFIAFFTEYIEESKSRRKGKWQG
jgi:flagellar biosynthesis protein FliQ